MKQDGGKLRKVVGIGMTLTMVVAMAAAPVNAAASAPQEQRVVSYYAIDRAEIENLQRWVAAGHEDWCRNARLVAAEQLRRLAPDFSGDAMELDQADSEIDPSGAGMVTFAWAPLDGRALYRVTVERFEWLLAIAKHADAIVWVPTAAEIYLNPNAVSSEEGLQLVKA